MKTLVKVMLVIALLTIGVFGYGSTFLGAQAQAKTPTGATYEVFVRTMLADQKAQYPYLYNFSPAYVQTNWEQNQFFLKPLLDNINGYFPKNNPLTKEDLTQFALAKVQVIAIEAKAACEKGVIDFWATKGKFPTTENFKGCDKPNDPLWWAEQYAANNQAVVNAFDAGQLYKENRWAENRYYLLKNEFCYGLPVTKCW